MRIDFVSRPTKDIVGVAAELRRDATRWLMPGSRYELRVAHDKETGQPVGMAWYRSIAAPYNMDEVLDWHGEVSGQEPVEIVSKPNLAWSPEALAEEIICRVERDQSIHKSSLVDVICMITGKTRGE